MKTLIILGILLYSRVCFNVCMFWILWKLSLLNCVPCVLKTCSRAKVPYVLTGPHNNVSCVLMRSSTNVSCLLTCSRTNVPCVLTYSCNNVPYVLRCSRVNVLMCSCVNVPFLVTLIHM